MKRNIKAAPEAAVPAQPELTIGLVPVVVDCTPAEGEEPRWRITVAQLGLARRVVMSPADAAKLGLVSERRLVLWLGKPMQIGTRLEGSAIVYRERITSGAPSRIEDRVFVCGDQPAVLDTVLAPANQADQRLVGAEWIDQVEARVRGII